MSDAVNARVRVALEKVERAPRDDKAFQEAWSLLVSNEDYKTLVQMTERAAGRRSDPDMFCRAGDAALTYLRDQDRALLCYQRALELDPKHVKALGGARPL